MARETKYLYQVATLVQTDDEQPVTQRRGTYLTCLFFVVLSAWR